MRYCKGFAYNDSLLLKIVHLLRYGQYLHMFNKYLFSYFQVLKSFSSSYFRSFVQSLLIQLVNFKYYRLVCAFFRDIISNFFIQFQLFDVKIRNFRIFSNTKLNSSPLFIVFYKLFFNQIHSTSNGFFTNYLRTRLVIVNDLLIFFSLIFFYFFILKISSKVFMIIKYQKHCFLMSKNQNIFQFFEQ